MADDLDPVDELRRYMKWTLDEFERRLAALEKRLTGRDAGGRPVDRRPDDSHRPPQRRRAEA